MNLQIAEFFYKEKYVKGDVVALLMENRPEYPTCWMGLSKLGVIAALINTNLKRDGIVHSIKVANCKAIIVSEEYLDVIIEILDHEVIKNLKIYVYDAQTQVTKLESHNLVNLSKEIESISPQNTTFQSPELTAKDKLFFIYTSGTTGLPKAAVITHFRYFLISVGSPQLVGIQEDDIIYNTLPLYHSAGGMLGTGVVILIGATVVLRKKFSASNFWTDCIKYNCTVRIFSYKMNEIS